MGSYRLRQSKPSRLQSLPTSSYIPRPSGWAFRPRDIGEAHCLGANPAMRPLAAVPSRSLRSSRRRLIAAMTGMSEASAPGRPGCGCPLKDLVKICGHSRGVTSVTAIFWTLCLSWGVEAGFGLQRGAKPRKRFGPFVIATFASVMLDRKLLVGRLILKTRR